MDRRQFLGVVGISASAGCLARLGSRPTADSLCPPFPGARDGQTICDGKERDLPVYLHAESDTVPTTDGTITFAFVNTADEAVAYGPCYWTLYEDVPDGWQMIRPIQGHAIGKILPANSSHDLTLRVGHQDATPLECGPYAVSELDTEQYLFGIRGDTPDGTTTLFLASFRAE